MSDQTTCTVTFREETGWAAAYAAIAAELLFDQDGEERRETRPGGSVAKDRGRGYSLQSLDESPWPSR
jgi:hypothetical protein